MKFKSKNRISILHTLAALALAGTASISLTSTAHAASFDAFSSFDGTQGAGGFSYGVFDGTTYSPFATNTNCFIANSICLQQAPNFDVPGATKSATTSVQYGGVNVPIDRLLVHPGQGNAAVYVLFTAPTASYYQVTGGFSIQDNTPTGVLISDTLGNSVLLNGTGASLSYSNLIHLNAGETFGFSVGNAGFYYNDSTGLNFTLTAVPEPATWGLMFMGFGMVGAGLRARKRKADAASAY